MYNTIYVSLGLIPTALFLATLEISLRGISIISFTEKSIKNNGYCKTNEGNMNHINQSPTEEAKKLKYVSFWIDDGLEPDFEIRIYMLSN